MREPFSIRARLRSFRYAFSGLAVLLRETHNARIHLAATLLVLGLAEYFNVSRQEWLVLLLAIGLVWLAEALNSALEYLADAAVPEQHELVRKSKDVAAAGVLIASFIAAVVGLSVFGPYFF